jgi:alkanesulfonate monooxygenase SsuD/methylene tetrahydromethanopterin reductase-like flavin-dependent oxidoreductase (luciferase family)
MRLSTVVLPIYRWPEAETVWRRVEALGFHAAYTYDHLSWRSFRDRPWFGAVPTLAAAAGVTRELRLGTLVASPNFRHPVLLAKDLMTLDDLSGGRLTVGIGAGGTGYDATVLGQSPWSPGERAERFAEFVTLLDRLLTGPATTWQGRHYAADEARMIPGCVQQPRVPLLVAAAGPRGMDLVAEFGQGWVTFGDPAGPEEQSADQARRAVGDQLTRLAAVCTRRGREVTDLDRVLLHGLSTEQPLDSVDAFVDWAGRYGELGITEVVIHWPVPDSVFAADVATFERIATEAPGQLAGSPGSPGSG